MSLAQDIINLRYAWDKGDGTKESWEEIAQRVSDNVLAVFNVKQGIKDAIYEIIARKKFIPGGRFLAQAGRKTHQVCNCFLLRAEDTREGWAELMKKASMMLMTGGGIGIDYSLIRPAGSPLISSGGTASGSLPLMSIINEIGRGVMAGGKRRSAIWAGLSWKNKDIFDFIQMKNWKPEVRKLKEQDFNFPAPMDMTNISVILDREFFEAFEKGDTWAKDVYWKTVKRMCKTGEPGFSINYENSNESLRNAPVCGDVHVLTDSGYKRVIDIVDKPVNLWTGKRFAENVVFKKTKENAEIIKVIFNSGNFIRSDREHEFFIINDNELVKKQAQELKIGDKLYFSLPNGEVGFYFVENVIPDGYEDVYCCDVKYPEHSFMAEGVIISNCTEITSEDDCDVCCLGSINLANIGTLEELEWVTELAVIFLLCGTEYSDVPYPKVKDVREKNRRIGLGLMGIHEWLILRGYRYEPNLELEEWLRTWQEKSDEYAKKWADKFNIVEPIKKRAIAPNGSISIVGETTSGIEPIFAVAYLRRYLTPQGWQEKVIVDPVAERLIKLGVNPDNIEDAYILAEDVERRIQFQAFVQQFVDNAISSTINLPAWGTTHNSNYEEFGNILYKYLKDLRGITVYPDGARGGQPLVRVDYKDIFKYNSKEYEEHESCVGGVCGI